MTVAARGHFDADHLSVAADWQRPQRETLRQSARHDFGRVNQRVTKFPEQRQTADVILVAVTEHERINRTKAIDIGQEAWRRTFADVEHQPLTGRFDHKAGRTFAADAGDEAQCVWPCAHWHSPFRSAVARWNDPNIDKLKARP
jgi:hypothetical protein